MNARKSYEYAVQYASNNGLVSVPTIDRASARLIKNAFNAAYGEDAAAKIVQRMTVEKVIR